MLKLWKFCIEKTTTFTKIHLAVSSQEDMSCFLHSFPFAVFTQPLRSYPLQVAVTLKLFLCASIHSSVSLLSTNRDPSCLSMCSNKKPSSSLASDRSACGRPHQALWILFLESVTEFRQCVSRMFLGLLIPFQASVDLPSGGPPGSFSFVCSFHKGLPHM